nr:hypothetical protein [Propionispira raffinosivorans]
MALATLRYATGSIVTDTALGVAIPSEKTPSTICLRTGDILVPASLAKTQNL